MDNFELEKVLLREELSAKKVGRGRRYGKHKSEAERLQIVKVYLTGRYSLEECAKVFHIGERTLTRWIDKFANEKTEASVPEARVSEAPAALPAAGATDGLFYNRPTMTHMAKKNNPQEETPEAMKAEIDRLKRELEIANYKVHVRDVIIEEAEKTFNIPIRKKSGAKQ